MSSAFLVFLFTFLLILNCFMYTERKHFKSSQVVVLIISILILLWYIGTKVIPMWG